MSNTALSLTKGVFTDLSDLEEGNYFVGVRYYGTKSSSVSKPIKFFLEGLKPVSPILTFDKTSVEPGIALTSTQEPFSSPKENDKHIATEWRISRDPEGLDIVETIRKEFDFSAMKMPATELWDYLYARPEGFWTDGSQFQNRVENFDIDYIVSNFTFYHLGSTMERWMNAITINAYDTGYAHPTSTDFDIAVERFAPGMIIYTATPNDASKYTPVYGVVATLTCWTSNHTNYTSNKNVTVMLGDIEQDEADGVIAIDATHCMLIRCNKVTGVTKFAIVASSNSF